jgi:type IV secretion system protein VirB6/type IV secretion system protein TrbL
MVKQVLHEFDSMDLHSQILEAARNLFWSLAAISLVWTMGALIIRQDIGEMLMELLRFIVVTGTFYWLLINASSREGGEDFVRDIVGSFFQMSNGSAEETAIRSHADGLLSRGLNVFYRVIAETQSGNPQDQLLTGGIAVLILVMCALMAAQFVVALVMAWMLSYAGIFLLGFGGARWTSPIAISFYKHVVAVGVALLALSLIGVAATRFLDIYDHVRSGTGLRSAIDFPYLGGLLAALVLMVVLSIRVPQMLYTLVTGSPLGMFTGAATIAGHAVATGGSAAWASAMSALPHGGGDGGAAHRRGADAVMDAVQRSAAGGGVGDAFHVNAGTDPFGMARSADPHRGPPGGSAFAGTEGVVSPVTRSGQTGASMPAHGTVEVGAETSSSVRQTNQTMQTADAGSPPSPSPASPSRTGSPGVAASAGSDGAIERPDYAAELGAIEAAKNDASAVSTIPHAAQPTLDVEGAAAGAVESQPDRPVVRVLANTPRDDAE